MEAFERGSLLVPCVQELAKESPTAVPARYIRPDQDPPITSYSSPPDVPIIDMEKLLSGDQMELKKLDSACKEWGFFQLINHGVSSALLEKAKMEINEFFNLPMEEKKKFWQDSKDYEGFGQAFVFSEEQKLDWADMFALTTLPTHLRKPHLFPKLPLPFRDTLDNYANELKHLAMKILDFISNALKMKTEEMRDLFKDGRQAIRMNYYPPCPQPEKVIGFTPHSDSVGLTILLQINEVEGLQIRKDGEWVPVKPLPETFVVNIGDILEGCYSAPPNSALHLGNERLAFVRVQIKSKLSAPRWTVRSTALHGVVRRVHYNPSHSICLTLNVLEGLPITFKNQDGARAFPNRKIVTNGVYRSIEHRAVVNSRKERLSIATAYSPGYDEEMGPAPSMVTPQTPALFRRIRVAEYFKGLFAQKLDGKSYCDAMRIQNQSQES